MLHLRLGSLAGGFTRHLVLAGAVLLAGLPPAHARATAAAVPAAPAGLAALSDDAGALDQISLQALDLPPAPDGSRYRVWLASQDGARAEFVGELAPDAGGRGQLSWSQPSGDNLLEQYSQVLVTLEPAAQPAAEPGPVVVLHGQVDETVLAQVRRLLVRWPGARFGTASLQGLRRLALLARGQSAALERDAAAGDLAAVRRKAEHLVNLIEGEQGAYYGDHNGDGRVEDPGDGVGLLRYAWGAHTQARTAWAQARDEQLAAAALALEPPLLYGLDWAGFVRDVGLQLAAAQDPAQAQDLAGHVQRAVARVVASVDPHGEPALDQVLAERGLPAAYAQALTLARLPLEPSCRFVRGFAALQARLPGPIGLCLENEHFAPNGDAQQRTTGGLLMWRKADNWTAFTDGYRTWISRAEGLAQRLNAERFPWESP